MTDQAVGDLIRVLAIFGGLLLLVALGQLFVNLWALRRIEQVHHSTNSMKDALVKVTGESEFARGLKQGEEAPRPVPGSSAR